MGWMGGGWGVAPSPSLSSVRLGWWVGGLVGGWVGLPVCSAKGLGFTGFFSLPLSKDEPALQGVQSE